MRLNRLPRLVCTRFSCSPSPPSRTMSSNREVPMAPRKEDEDVWKYPRPPLLQRTPNLLRVVWTDLEGNQTVIAETDKAFRVLETSHPPTYYLPPSSLKLPVQALSRSTFCEWKGQASYYAIRPPGAKKPIENRIWYYKQPNPSFVPLKDHVSFYASTGVDEEEVGGRWDCFVDDEKVVPQAGDFYGGWLTSNIKGKTKGGPGTWVW
ncbi:hypothetical protein BD324DRAFT_625082 [Kockovaella imperatae]|uniref:DUF427 domain-containing protein n=1 Tax=Kockovaella imperatae TaxID=4999 RepID=A0A1Y1UGN3_9TREE|nr:hypothetical protein BD324DRAFT_625082 [Kockovaella imperatae]ORX37182.1 hypothetical protein BD324DRAFT_625082 [Kockovaella imperatae]